MSVAVAAQCHTRAVISLRRSFFFSIFLASLLLAVLGLAVAQPAAAHSDLLSSTPANGAQLQQAPTSIELVFNEALGTTGLQLVASGPNGPVALGLPEIEGPRLSAQWPAETAAGEYTIGYRVVSADGHPIDGAIKFSYLESSQDPTATREQGVVSGNDAPVIAPEPVTTEATAEPAFPWWIAGLVVVGVGLGAGVAYAMRATRNKP